jgi:hypothetical protein
MNLEEIDKDLPNGFHDAKIKSVNLNYETRVARILLDLWTGDLTSKEESIREARKRGELVLKDFLFFVIEPPDPNYEYAKPSALWIDARSFKNDPKRKEVKLPQDLPENAFVYRVFVSDWNSFIYFAATDCALELKKESINL